MASELLFVLLAHPQGLSKEKIGATIWPESEPEKMKVNFRKTIYRLRRALGQDVVLFDERTERYAFNWELDYDYDVAAFRARLEEAGQADEAGTQICAYRKALELYGGAYLWQAEGAWAWPLREALAHAYREAALSLAKLYFERRRYDEVLSCCRRLLAEDPCLEQAHRLAMRVYAAEGNMSGVVRQFTDCQEALRHELKVSPSQQTVELHDLLIHGS